MHSLLSPRQPPGNPHVHVTPRSKLTSFHISSSLKDSSSTSTSYVNSLKQDIKNRRIRAFKNIGSPSMFVSTKETNGSDTLLQSSSFPSDSDFESPRFSDRTPFDQETVSQLFLWLRHALSEVSQNESPLLKYESEDKVYILWKVGNFMEIRTHCLCIVYSVILIYIMHHIKFLFLFLQIYSTVFHELSLILKSIGLHKFADLMNRTQTEWQNIKVRQYRYLFTLVFDVFEGI